MTRVKSSFWGVAVVAAAVAPVVFAAVAVGVAVDGVPAGVELLGRVGATTLSLVGQFLDMCPFW